MSISELKTKQFGLDKSNFGRIFSFVDFGNVNYWFEQDERGADNKPLSKGKKLVVDIASLANFLKLFSEQTRFYFGLDKRKPKSLKIITKSRAHFDKTVTKPIQRIRHYLLGTI